MKIKLIKDWTRKGKTVKAGSEVIIAKEALPWFQDQGLVAGGKQPKKEPEAPKEEKRSIWGKA